MDEIRRIVVTVTESPIALSLLVLLGLLLGLGAGNGLASLWTDDLLHPPPRSAAVEPVVAATGIATMTEVEVIGDIDGYLSVPALSADGTTVLYATDDGTFTVGVAGAARERFPESVDAAAGVAGGGWIAALPAGTWLLGARGDRVRRLGPRASVLAASADGRLWAWADLDGVGIAAVAGGGEARVASVGAGDVVHDLAWSPDGRWLAVLSTGEVEGTRLEIVGPSGQGPRVLHAGDDLLIPESNRGAVAWLSPDRLVFLRVVAGRAVLAGVDHASDPEVEQAAVLHQWRGAVPDSLSRGGDRLVYRRLVRTNNVRVVDLAAHEVAWSAGVAAGPGDWSSEDAVYATREVEGESRVFVFSAQGGSAEPVTLGPGNDAQPRVAENLMVFVRTSPAGTEIARSPVSGGEATIALSVELPDPTLRCAGKLCWVAAWGEAAREAFEIDPAAGVRTGRVVALDGASWAVSADGRRVVWVDPDRAAVAVAGSDGGEPLYLPVPLSLPQDLAWSGSGPAYVGGIGHEDARYAVVRLDLGSGASELVWADDTAGTDGLSVSPSGERLAIGVVDVARSVGALEIP